MTTPTTEAPIVRAVLLPQDGMPRVIEARDTLEHWYTTLRCRTIAAYPFLPGGAPAWRRIIVVCDDEGRLVEKAPNPWTMLLGRSDLMGDVALVESHGDAFGSVDPAWAAALVAALRAHCEPSTRVLTEDDPDLPEELRAFLRGGSP